MAPVARADPRAGGGHTYVYRTTFPLDAASSSSSAASNAAQIAEIRVQVLQPGIRLNVDRFLLQVPFASRFRLAYDAPPVRIWENTAALPRAWWVGSYVVEPDAAAHLELLKSPGFDPRRQAALYADPGLSLGGSSASAPPVRVDAETANTVRLSLDAPADGLLVVSQTAAPGWRALVDGHPAPVLPADGILQAIPVTAGAHRVVLRYLPQSFVAGATISLVALALLAAWGAAWRLRRHRDLSSRERITPSAGSGGRGSGLARATGGDTAA
jgi:hypothetical protein